MYIIRIFDPEHGDIENIRPADAIDDAIVYVLETVNPQDCTAVEITREGKVFRIVVKQGDTTLALIEDIEPVRHATFHGSPLDHQVIDACDAMVDGQFDALRALFMPAGSNVDGTQSAASIPSSVKPAQAEAASASD